MTPATEWAIAPPRPRLLDDVVDVWIADIGASAAPGTELLSASERARAARFAQAQDGYRWAAARSILRSLLGRYLDADPRELRFGAGPDGKPVLDPEAGACFNLSHAGEIALYAFAAGRQVGVDVELASRSVDAVALAERLFGAAEATRLRSLDEASRQREFLRAWVRYEAAVKCLGTGIVDASALRDRADPPSIVELDVGPGAAAAVAVGGAAWRLRCFRWHTAP